LLIWGKLMANKKLMGWLVALGVSHGVFVGAFAHPAAAFQTHRVAVHAAPGIKFHIADNNKLVAGAETFVSSMAGRAIDFLSDTDLTEEKRKKEFKKLLHTSFDMKTLARFALGRYWKTSTPQQKNEYNKLFEDMVIDVYSHRFSDYKGQKFEVRKARADGKKDAIVTSFIVPDSGPEVEVQWRIRYKDGRYKVIDVIVAGVSMALTQRSDFASVIQRGGGQVEVLIAHLRKDE